MAVVAEPVGYVHFSQPRTTRFKSRTSGHLRLPSALTGVDNHAYFTPRGRAAFNSDLTRPRRPVLTGRDIDTLSLGG